MHQNDGAAASPTSSAKIHYYFFTKQRLCQPLAATHSPAWHGRHLTATNAALAQSSVALDRHQPALHLRNLAALAPSCTASIAKVSQPLAAEPHQPKRKRTQTGTRVQLAGQRPSCSVSLRGALMARLQQARASRETWTRKHW